MQVVVKEMQVVVKAHGVKLRAGRHQEQPQLSVYLKTGSDTYACTHVLNHLWAFFCLREGHNTVALQHTLR